MKYLALLLLLPISALAQWFNIADTDIEARYQQSRGVAVLHWNVEAGDYLVENIKGEIERSKMPGHPATWIEAVGDAFKGRDTILVFLASEEVDGLYVGQTWLTPSSPSASRDTAVEVSVALKILRKKKGK